MQTPQTFELSRGRTFVAGLLWQPLAGTIRDYKRETTRLANELSLDLAVWRTSGALHVGMTSVAAGGKPGWLSAAAVVSKTLEVENGTRSFLCATAVPGGRWLFVAQRDGIILPDGDYLAGEDEIRSRMLGDMSLGDWDLIIAPDHWGLTKSNERAFQDFLPKKGSKEDFKRWWGLSPIKSKPLTKLLPIVALAAAIGAGGFGYMKWQQYKRAQELARQAALANPSGQVVKLPHPWKSQPRASVFLEECMGAFTKVKTLFPGNWTLNEATCANGSFSIVWARQDTGWIDHLVAVEPEAQLAADGATASRTIPLDLPAGEDEEVGDGGKRILAIHALSQRYGFKVSMQHVDPPPPLPGDKQENQPVRDWKEINWQVTGVQMPPEIVLKAMDAPGFRVAKISAGLSEGLMNWKMEGTQYVLP